MEKPAAVPVVDMSRPHMARIYDYFLGGQNHFAPDRELDIGTGLPASRGVGLSGGVARKP
jgi:hypothetical protein